VTSADALRWTESAETRRLGIGPGYHPVSSAPGTTRNRQRRVSQRQSRSGCLTFTGQGTGSATCHTPMIARLVRVKRPRPWVFALVAASALAIAGFAFDAWFMPRRAPVFDHPSVWQVMIASRWVVGAIRLTGLIAGLYLILSIIARAWQGRWLTKVGSAEVGDSVQEVTDDRERLQRELDTANETIAKLRQELTQTLSLAGPDADTDVTNG